MRSTVGLLLAVGLVACGDSGPAEPVDEIPPLGPTIFIDPDIIPSDGPSALVSVDAAGTGDREMFDRREDAFVTYEAHLFDASFDDGLAAEIQVNPEFDATEALELAELYADAIGRLPTALRADVETVWIHGGDEDFGGGSANILIHTGRADAYSADGILEEALAHEAAHTSLDDDHAQSAGWLAAQQLDGVFISQYAKDNPLTEDVAETIVAYIAVTHGTDGITDFLEALIRQAIPARIEYLDAQGFDMHPLN